MAGEGHECITQRPNQASRKTLYANLTGALHGITAQQTCAVTILCDVLADLLRDTEVTQLSCRLVMWESTCKANTSFVTLDCQCANLL